MTGLFGIAARAVRLDQEPPASATVRARVSVTRSWRVSSKEGIVATLDLKSDLLSEGPFGFAGVGDETVWARLLVLALQRRSYKPIDEIGFAWMDALRPDLNDETPFTAARDYESFARMWASLVLDQRPYPRELANARLCAFCELGIAVTDLMTGGGDLLLKQVWEEVRASTPTHLHARLKMSIEEIDCGETLMEIISLGDLDRLDSVMARRFGCKIQRHAS